MYNPRPFTLSVGGGACLATAYAPTLAITTEICARLIEAGASVTRGGIATTASVVEWGAMHRDFIYLFYLQYII